MLIGGGRRFLDQNHGFALNGLIAVLADDRCRQSKSLFAEVLDDLDDGFRDGVHRNGCNERHVLREVDDEARQPGEGCADESDDESSMDYRPTKSGLLRDAAVEMQPISVPAGDGEPLHIRFGHRLRERYLITDARVVITEIERR